MISQQQTQKQQLKILPQQIQLLNLYFLNTLELEQRIKNELEENPFLDATTEEASDEATKSTDVQDYQDWDEYGYDDVPDYKHEYQNYFSTEQTPNMALSNVDHFKDDAKQQLRLLDITEDDREVAEYIIDVLNNQGLMDKPLEEVADDYSFHKQSLVEYKGEVWVVSGDYKIEDDGVTVPFEPVKCNTFITESTFGLPIYQWRPQAEIIENIHQWVLHNQQMGRYSVLSAYSLGKAQRLIHALSAYGHKFYGHGAIYYMNLAIQQIMPFPDVTYLRPETPKEEVKNGIIIMPSSDTNNPWLRKWQPSATGICSGWMQVRGAQRRRNADAGFALSDHADWQGLLQAIKATGAECIYVTHGFSAPLARYLKEEYGLKTGVVKTAFGEDEE